MDKLNRQLHAVDALPERVIQFGEGNFLRAFADWMLQQMNKQGLFNGRAVLVQPIAEGLSRQINEQDGLYTLFLRGLKQGQPYEEQEIISSVSRCLNPYGQWQECLQCAENPEIEFVISNTTEAGITYEPADKLENEPPSSFPGKLTAYLYHRFVHFSGEAAKGMVILPCELIDRNGDNLKKIVLRLAEDWQLPAAFAQWIEQHNYFLNTLVDRVVTGYPRDEIQELEAKLGYQDAILDTGELFHLWVIEGPEQLAERLPLTQAGLQVIWTADMTPYRTRKVRILNGAHTASVPAAFLYGLDTVGEMMEHEIMGKYVQQIVFDEIIPSIKLDKAMLTDFAASVMDRFRNPFIKHYLLSILLNSSSKFKARVLPSILDYQEQYGKLPDKLTFSLAALLAVYKDGKVAGSGMNACREQGEFVMKDDMAVLEFLAAAWRGFDGSPAAAQLVARTVLGNAAIWGQDLNQFAGLTDKVAGYLYSIAADGLQATVRKLVQ